MYKVYESYKTGTEFSSCSFAVNTDRVTIKEKRTKHITVYMRIKLGGG